MTKHKKIIEDSHYVALLESLIAAMEKFPEVFELTISKAQIPSQIARVIYHETMRDVVKDIDTELIYLDTAAIAATLEYHDDLIKGDINHRHPRNIVSELLNLHSSCKDQRLKAGYAVCMYSIPIDLENVDKLINTLVEDGLHVESRIANAFNIHHWLREIPH